MLKVIFMGTPDYAAEILATLVTADDIEVVAVYTQPDKPVGRKRIMTPSPVKLLAQEHHIDLYQPQSIRDESVVMKLQDIICDMIIVAAYGQLLPKTILEYAPCINLHASVLPHYRGASPIQQSLLNGDRSSGVTAMLMDEGMDTGAILKIVDVDIADDEMAATLFHRLTQTASQLTLEVLRTFHTLTPISQDDTQATYCKKITRSDGEVYFDDARHLYNKYRAYTPWPGLFLSSGLKLKVMQLHETTSNNRAGTILEITKAYAIIGCERGSIKLLRVQPASKKELSVYDYINGKRLRVEDTLA